MFPDFHFSSKGGFFYDNMGKGLKSDYETFITKANTLICRIQNKSEKKKETHSSS
jgi:hypothetical protein